MNPLHTVSEAISLPFKAIGVIGLCLVINVMTSPGHWWVQWVVLGMGIAVISAWWRALKLVGVLAVLGGVAAVIWPRVRDAQQAAAPTAGASAPPPPPAPVAQAALTGTPGARGDASPG